MSRTEALWKPGLPLLRMEDSMDENGKDSYIAGMKRYRERGIPIVIDGEKCRTGIVSLRRGRTIRFIWPILSQMRRPGS